MIVGVCGLGNTGSMAVIDLLKEYDETFYSNLFHEFALCYCPDGLIDLEFHIVDNPSRFHSSDIAIYRFEKYIHNYFSSWDEDLRKTAIEVLNSFLDSIVQVEWKGTWGFRIDNYSFSKKMIYKILYKLRPVFGDNLFSKYANVQMKYSVRPENFDSSARLFISQIIKLANPPEDKIVLIDQAFSGDNPERCFKYFEDPYAIVVDRDPRDLYILSKYYIHADSLWIPTDNVENFITYYKQMRVNIDLLKEHKRILRIQYEDLIYNYSFTKRKIESFLNIKEQKQTEIFFKPQVSINNTQLYKDFKKEDENIRIIETALQDWLFDFSKYPSFIRSRKVW